MDFKNIHLSEPEFVELKNEQNYKKIRCNPIITNKKTGKGPDRRAGRAFCLWAEAFFCLKLFAYI
jgi:hypothetical protein